MNTHSSNLEQQGTKTYVDQLGRKILLQAVPRRIISIVPSQTELLSDLGLSEEVIGITKFCIHPDHWFRSKTRVGGTKQLDIDKIISLKPDLIIANKEENKEEEIKELEKHFPVWISDIRTLDDAYAMIEIIGEMTGKKIRALEVTISIQHAFKEFFEYRIVNNAFRIKKCAYLIWNNPLMTIGSDTFIHQMLEVAGFQNIFSDQERYPEVTLQDIIVRKPKLLFLSSEPFPFAEKHVSEMQEHLPDIKIMLVDGEMFSWYGSRLQMAPDYFRKLHDRLSLPVGRQNPEF